MGSWRRDGWWKLGRKGRGGCTATHIHGGETLGTCRVNLTSHARKKKRENEVKKNRQETSQCWLLQHPFPPGSQSMISQWSIPEVTVFWLALEPSDCWDKPQRGLYISSIKTMAISWVSSKCKTIIFWFTLVCSSVGRSNTVKVLGSSSRALYANSNKSRNLC